MPHAAPVDDLTQRQLDALHQLVADPATAPMVTARANLVLTEHRCRSAGHPRPPTPSRQVYLKWYGRYRAAGVAGLTDRPRAGRPVALADEVRREILCAPLRLADRSWTSRSVAGHAGVSQSTVARVWAETFPDDEAYGGAGRTGLTRLIGAYAGPVHCVLALESLDGPAPRTARHRSPMRSVLRPPAQVLLAAQLVADTVPAEDADGAREFAAGMLPATPPSTELLLVCTPGLELTAATAGRRVRVIELDRARWQSQLRTLVRLLPVSELSCLGEAQRRATDWARSPQRPFSWLRPDRSEAPVRSTPRPTDPFPDRPVAEWVEVAIRDALSRGQLRGGDRIIESHFARVLHTSRTQVRDALRTLQAHGLIEIQPGRGAVVPVPTIDDVLEVYAARRALGHLIVRAASRADPDRLEPVTAALTELLGVAAAGEVGATGEADIRLQDAVATACPLSRIPGMFVRLSAQIRMFVAVLGLDYAYSIEAIVHDDGALVSAVLRGDESAAAEAWESKMRGAVSYMLRQLPAGTRHRPASGL